MFKTNIWAYMKFEHQISEGTYRHIGPETEELYCFYYKNAKFRAKNGQKRALCADRHPLRRDTIASRDLISTNEGERQNLALYYKGS